MNPNSNLSNKVSFNSLFKVYLYSSIIFLTLLAFQMFYYNTFSLDFCFSNDCISNLYSRHSNLIILFSTWNKFFIGISALLGVHIAFKNYMHHTKDSIFNNHLKNMEFFVNFMHNEIQKLNHLDAQDVDFDILYGRVFPDSQNGNFTEFEGYRMKIQSMRKYIISHSNGYKKGLKTQSNPSSSFLGHRKKVTEFSKYFGIRVTNLPKNDFFQVERDIFNFIDIITRTFTRKDLMPRKSHLLTNIDIHYRS